MDIKDDMPLSLAFQMGMNENEMKNFAKMTDEEKRQVLEAARSTRSKDQMRSIVEDLGKMT